MVYISLCANASFGRGVYYDVGEAVSSSINCASKGKKLNAKLYHQHKSNSPAFHLCCQTYYRCDRGVKTGRDVLISDVVIFQLFKSSAQSTTYSLSFLEPKSKFSSQRHSQSPGPENQVWPMAAEIEVCRTYHE